MNSIDIFVNPRGDWYSVEINGEVIVEGHSPSVYDLTVLIERLTGKRVDINEDEFCGE